METARIREGDIIEWNVRGQTGYALVREALHDEPQTKRKVITLAPLGPKDFLLTRQVTSRQIINHWRKRRPRKEQHPNGISNGE